MPEVRATTEQLAAMRLRGGSLLVSAGAGSGKTWVLTQRLMSFIDPGHNGGKAADITDFLVITYTRAAAGELKTRIAEAISKAAAEESARPDPDMKRLAHLRMQTALTGKAHISTIHSFCSDLIREFGTTAGIRADFRVIEDERAETIKAAALSRILEQRYADPGNYPGFTDLSDKICRGRDDRALSELIIKTFDKLQSQAFPGLWVKNTKELLNRDYPDFARSPWGKEIQERTGAKASFWKLKMDRAIQELEEENGKTKEKYIESFSAASASLGRLCSVMDPENGSSWQECCAAANFGFVSLKTLRNPDDPDFKERMNKVWNDCKDACKKIRNDFAGDQDKILADIRATAPALEALLDAVMDFEHEYSREKRRNALMDYSDLEHIAAQILTDEDCHPTETAHAVAQRYTEIMVDEYQDVSHVQNTIFSAVSNNESNLFLVGDIKQSIYRFRLAAPEIFKERYESYEDWLQGEESGSKRISLRDNFRSSRQIINAVNSIFCSCMSTALGDIDYSSPDQQLKAPKDNAFDGARPELVIVQPPSGEDIAEDLSKDIDYEAEWVAGEVRRMLDSGMQIRDGETGTHAVGYSDIAILLRACQSVEPVFRRELEKIGIPVRSESSADFMSEPETAFIVNMLSITDNPHKDVPLLAVLRSPAFAFSADELAAVRNADKEADLYDALEKAAITDVKCRSFLSNLKELRDLAPGMPVTELVWKIICDNDLIAVSSAMKDGMRRRDRLLSFIECAAAYNESGFIGLHSFIGWLERMAKRDSLSGAGSGVAVMSVHKSKGLEFPVVFVSGTGKGFNTEDTKGRVLFDADLGIGSELIDLDRKIKYPTAVRTAISGKIRRENLSEEMRLLYVALTRAKERLIITGTDKNSEMLIKGIGEDMGGSVPEPELLAAYANRLKWLTAASIADGGLTFDRKVVEMAARAAADTVTPGDIPEPVDTEVNRLEQILRSNLGFKYAFHDDTELPTKITATELKGTGSIDDEAGTLLPEYEDPSAGFRLPDFGRADMPLSASEKGTATHLLLQYMDFNKSADISSVREETERLKKEGFLTERQAEAIDPLPVIRLFSSDIGVRMVKASLAGKLNREFRFSLLVDAKRFFTTGSEEQILLQGMVDCWFEEDDGIVIVDYKTDRVFRDDEIMARVDYYRGQIEAYSEALSRICGKTVKESVLFFLAPGKEVKLGIKE